MAANHAAGPALTALPFFFLSCRSPAQALLCWLFPRTKVHSHPLHQPLPWPLHHLHHWGQRHHNVHGALQPAKGKSRPWVCWLGNTEGWGSRGPKDTIPLVHPLVAESLSRLQAQYCNPSNSRPALSNSRPALPSGSHLPQPKAWFPCSCIKKQNKANREQAKLLLGKDQSKYFISWSQLWLTVRL